MYNLENIKWTLLEDSDEVNKIYETKVEYEEFIKWSSKQKIDGFRPGNVPLTQENQHKFLNDIVSFIFPKLQTERLFSVNYVLIKFKKDETIEFNMTVESLPIIPDIIFSDYQISKYSLKIIEEDIKKAIENYSIIESKEDKVSSTEPSKLNDFLKLEIKDDQTNQITIKDIKLGHMNLNPEIESKLVNQNINFILEHKINDNIKFSIKILDIKKGIKLTNQEIAEKLKIEEKDLNEKFKQDLIEISKNIEHKILNDTLFKIIVENNFIIPISCINKEYKELYTQTLHDIQYSEDMDLKALIKTKFNIEFEEFEKRLQTSAIFSAKLKFFFDYYANKNNIKITNEEITNLIQSRSKYFKDGVKEATEFFTKNEDEKQKLINSYIHPKIINELTSKLTIKDELELSFDELQKININNIKYEKIDDKKQENKKELNTEEPKKAKKAKESKKEIKK